MPPEEIPGSDEQVLLPNVCCGTFNDDDENDIPSTAMYYQQPTTSSSSQLDDIEQNGTVIDREWTGSKPPSNEYVLNVAFFTFVGFLSIQAVFAIASHSQAMLADSEAMSVDALTYLFNLVAERMKKRPLSENELLMPPELCQYKRLLRRLYLELIPPAISVVTLFIVTVMTLKESVRILRGIEDGSDTDTVSVKVMLLFSAINLLLDIVNVTCFARSNSLFGFGMIKKENATISDLYECNVLFDSNCCPPPNAGSNEKTPLVDDKTDKDCLSSPKTVYSSVASINDGAGQLGPCCGDCEAAACIEQDVEGKECDFSTNFHHPPTFLSNLNMCSAWTHICADTLRSTAVLLAAAIAVLVPGVDGAVADSVAAIVVSVIIFCSLAPLIQGLIVTGFEIIVLHRNPPRPF